MKIKQILLVIILSCLLGQTVQAKLTNNPADETSLNVTKYELVYSSPDMARVKVRANLVYNTSEKGSQHFDLYLPPDAKEGDRLPVIVFINGVGDFGENKLKDWAIYRSWAKMAATQGFASINFEADSANVPASITALFNFIDKQGVKLGLDSNRIGTFACSANVSTALPYLMTSATTGIKAAVFYYGAAEVEKFRSDLPVLHVFAGKEGAGLIQLQRRMLEKVREQQSPWTMITAPTLPHAFDALDLSDESLKIIKMTLSFWQSHLQPLPKPPVSTTGRRILSHTYGSEWDKALPLLQELAQQQPGNAEVMHSLGFALQNLQRFPEAEPYFKKAIELEPGRTMSWRALGMLQANTRNYGQAIKTLQHANQQGAKDGLLLSTLAFCQIHEKQYEPATHTLEQAIKTGFNLINNHYNLACAYALIGEKDRALTALEQAVRLGFKDAELLRTDEHLNNVRQEARFQALLK